MQKNLTIRKYQIKMDIKVIQPRTKQNSVSRFISSLTNYPPKFPPLYPCLVEGPFPFEHWLWSTSRGYSTTRSHSESFSNLTTKRKGKIINWLWDGLGSIIYYYFLLRYFLISDFINWNLFSEICFLPRCFALNITSRTIPTDSGWATSDITIFLVCFLFYTIISTIWWFN